MIIVFFSPIKHNEEVKDIYNRIFNNIPHFIKNRLHVDCLQDGFLTYKNKVIIFKRIFIRPIPDSIIPVDLRQKNYPSLILQLLT